ncbi:hypothetical protein Xmau_02681 [Xenorhabdus mauleonii]|uniref:Uncharacterized protein n=1 Tax=Xenorhabdus mauleonii TaxID=351675 RepID=A0A1I3UM69_9GAMM|nr:hypothetical protein [Xenorhabdus mauleonii]PHM39672.1 hypothetical protein Xmau_02681 [Xenorhabdus mauleonii]SFJ83016.1 hypothetical protein SAMN05421680_11736 [Xenorhabdus mauleonii]
MLTFPFQFFGLADMIENTPVSIVFLSTFGLLIPLLIVAILKNIPPLRVLSNIAAGTLALSFFPNLLVSISLNTLNVGGIHILFICMIIMLSCLFFIVFNYRALANFTEKPFSHPEPEIIGKRQDKKRGKKKK